MIFGFLPRGAMLVQYMPSRVCVCPLHAGIVSKWLNVNTQTTPHDSPGNPFF